ncbi:hypothetical protein CNMCM5793_000662 [Aspergillus hiratsukae]|uniref:C2H2-type domain-containing protein n=1 Tax=Aspergillus hiratsukae TaxID=1194566 RepID=A0A8H6UE25_9EURO|nr:hypothetical protein CNMCM5793_000662 [Aspergillus hiratsukae]KAF7163017.1 hypothetical protein CNMCM6106_000102 [Aspergillus hiratsukae]
MIYPDFSNSGMDPTDDDRFTPLSKYLQNGIAPYDDDSQTIDPSLLSFDPNMEMDLEGDRKENFPPAAIECVKGAVEMGLAIHCECPARKGVKCMRQLAEDNRGLMLVVGSGGVGLIDGNQHDHNSDLNHAPVSQGIDPPCLDQLPTMGDTSADRMNTTSYSTGHGVAQRGVDPTLDTALTPDTWPNGLPYSTEQGVTNQLADLNIDQGTGYTTPGISSSYRAPEVIPDEPEPSYSSPPLQQGGRIIQRSRPLPELLPKPTQNSTTPQRQSSSGDKSHCRFCPKACENKRSLRKHETKKHGAPKGEAGRPPNWSRPVA